MSLLSDLLSDKQNSLIFLQLLNGESIVPHLMTYFQHSSLNVKKTALVTINKIILAINNNSTSGSQANETSDQFSFETFEKKENLAMLFRLLYQQSILLPSEHSFKMLETLIEQLWTTLCIKLSVPYLVNICFPYITTWILLMMHSPNQAIDSIYLGMLALLNQIIFFKWLIYISMWVQYSKRVKLNHQRSSSARIKSSLRTS